MCNLDYSLALGQGKSRNNCRIPRGPPLSYSVLMDLCVKNEAFTAMRYDIDLDDVANPEII